MAITPRLLASAFLAGSLALAGAASTGCSSASTRTGFTDTDGGLGAPTGPGGEPTTDGGTTTPPAQPSKPGCAMDKYTEAMPTTASLTGLTYSQAQAQAYVVSALERRYPIGKFILEGGLTSPLAASQGNCVDRFLQDKTSAGAVLRQAPTLVHECGHFFDLGEASGSSSAYVVTNAMTFTCKSGDTTSRGGRTFARSLIKSDTYYAKRKACGGSAAMGCDFYADVYLDGSPTDGQFQGGDQGYSSVLEETTQYVNSLATALAFEDQYVGTQASERDGILTFLWYVERYLKMAREDYADAYTLLSTDSCWRQATLTVWDRAWFFLNATKGKSSLGLDDTAIEALVKDATLTAEIDALRNLECK